MITMSPEIAYAAMFYFLKDLYTRTQSDEIGSLLGSMSLREDGRPWDRAFEADWQRAVEKAIKMGGAPHCDIKKE